ncbi:MAG: ABC transporter permease [Acidobacteriota bacterium]
METIRQDLRFGVRMLLKNPGFTVVALLTLALGIGVNTAIFSVVYSVLLRPLPYPDAERLVVTGISVPDFRDLKEANQVFDETAIWASNMYTINDGGEPEQLRGAVVSPSFFKLLGQPAAGRTFQPEEDQEPLVVLSYDLWKQRFGGEAGAIGRTLNLGGRSHTIVGVMPPEFQFPDSQFKLWVTFGSALSQTPAQAENRQLRIFRCIARLAPGVSLQQAQTETASIFKRLEEQYPATNTGVTPTLTPLYDRIVGDVRPALMILLATAGFVLLIACANVANLMLARTTAREREIVIRVALGAGRWRVARQLLTESVLLAGFGGALGTLLAVWGVDLLTGLNPSGIPRLSSISISIPVLLFTLGVSLFTGILFGLAPVTQALRLNLNDALKEGGRGIGGSAWGRRLRGGLVVAEIALSLVVLVGAGLLVKSFSRLMNADAGFVADNLLTMNIELFHFKDPQQRAAIQQEVIARIEQIPGVEAAGGGSGLPPVTAQRVTRFAAEGQDVSTSQQNTGYFIGTSPGYFHALGTPLIQGRVFDERDSDTAPKVVVINKTLAARLFPGEDPIGKRLKLINPEQSDQWRSIVGIVGDVKYSGLDDTGDAVVYTPFAQTPFLWSYVMVRAAGDPSALIPSIRHAVSSVNPTLAALQLKPMRDTVWGSVSQPRFNMILLSSFAVLALALAVVGLYGVMSYLVAQRTREIGVRMALGASSTDVLKLVLRHGLALAGTGIVFGLAAAFAATRVLSSMLFGLSSTDPATFAFVALLLTAVAVAASVIPARRAIRVDPMVALRYE